MKEEKIFKKKIHAIKNPHERCKFLVNLFIEVTSKQNDKKKLKIIRKSLASLAGANCPEAYLYLGKLYYLPNNNNDKAYNSFKNAIKKGYPLAYYEFGYMVEKGLGCKKSKSKAVGYYIKAASCGSIDAMFRLGTAYIYKELGLDCVPKGIKYLDKATVFGHGEAAYKLSNVYERGINGHLDPNQKEALHYLQESADLLYTPALDKLGWTYENGRMGNEKDKRKAFYYYLEASKNGYSQSMYSLAGLIMNNAELDDKLAFDWMLKATKVAEPLNKAFYGMGIFYEYGVGVAKNLVAALDWYKKAKDNNVPDADKKIKDLENKITNLRVSRNNISLIRSSTDYTYSSIAMPSPVISFDKNISNKNKNVIITKDQLNDFNLTINSEGKVVSTSNVSNASVQVNVDSNAASKITVNSTNTDFNNNNLGVVISNPKRLSSLNTAVNNNTNIDNTSEMKSCSNENNYVTKKSPQDVEVKLIENDNKEYTIIPPERKCVPVISPLALSESVKLSSDDSENMEPTSKTKTLKKLSMEIPAKVSIGMDDSNSDEKLCKPELYKIDSKGNIELSDNEENEENKENKENKENDKLVNSVEEKLSATDDNKNSIEVPQVTLSGPDNDSFLPLPFRVSSFSPIIDEIDEIYSNNADGNENNAEEYDEVDDDDDDNENDDNFLGVDDDINDAVSDVEDFNYDPVQLNSNNVDIIDEESKISKIKASKSIKTYIPLPRRIESHDNPMVNGYFDGSTVSSSAFVNHFNNLSKQNTMNNSDYIEKAEIENEIYNVDDGKTFIDRKESQRIYNEEVKLSYEERTVNNNEWIDRHPTVLSITTNSSDMIPQTPLRSSMNSIPESENNHRISELSNVATVNYPLHKYSDKSNNSYASNISSPLVNSSIPINKYNDNKLYHSINPPTPPHKDDNEYSVNISSPLIQSYRPPKPPRKSSSNV